TDRHIVVFQCSLGLAQGESHEVGVTWEEALAHRCRRARCQSWCDPHGLGRSSLRKTPMPPDSNGQSPASPARWGLIAAVCSAALAGLGASPALPAAGAAVADAAAPSEILVKYAAVTLPRARVATARGTGAADPVVVRSHTRLLRLAPSVNIASALERLR